MADDKANTGKRVMSSMQQVSMAIEMPFVMVAWIVALGAGGYFLDKWLHAAPFLMLLGGAAGFGLGLRDLLRRLSAGTKRGGNAGG